MSCRFYRVLCIGCRRPRHLRNRLYINSMEAPLFCFRHLLHKLCILSPKNSYHKDVDTKYKHFLLKNSLLCTLSSHFLHFCTLNNLKRIVHILKKKILRNSLLCKLCSLYWTMICIQDRVRSILYRWFHCPRCHVYTYKEEVKSLALDRIRRYYTVFQNNNLYKDIHILSINLSLCLGNKWVHIHNSFQLRFRIVYSLQSMGNMWWFLGSIFEYRRCILTRKYTEDRVMYIKDISLRYHNRMACKDKWECLLLIHFRSHILNNG